jgi:hypothetical protein
MSPETIELLTQIIRDHGVAQSDSVKSVIALHMPDGLAWLEQYHDQTVQTGTILNYPTRGLQIEVTP